MLLKFIRHRLIKNLFFNEVAKKSDKYKVITALVTIAIFSPIKILGFTMGDHEELTKIAIKEFFRCVQPEMLNLSNRATLNHFTNIIVNANRDEDMNYLAKMVQYSHFYNPYFYVNVKWFGLVDRCPSNYRIYHLEQAMDAYLKGNEIQVLDLAWDEKCQTSSMLNITNSIGQVFEAPPSNTVLNFKLFHIDNQSSEAYETYFDMLGHAIHHLQDMSVPTHVVPILHPFPNDSPGLWDVFPWDGFEDNDNRVYVLNGIASESNEQSSDKICAFQQSTPQTLFDILDQSARNTLNAIKQEVLVYVLKPEDNRGFQSFYGSLYATQHENFRPMTVTWEKWYDTSSALHNANHIGQYGVYQDAFGLTEFEMTEDDPSTPQNERGWIIHVHRGFYDLFTYQQYRQAIEDTKKALYYAYLRILDSQQNLGENN